MMFNPSEHLMQLSGKDYLEVKYRLVWFREQCPQGTIDTEELAVDLDRETEEEISVWNNETRKKEKVVKRAKGYARYRAIVTDGKGGRATATKSEKAASFPDFCEKAETGAVGRALAMLGYGTQFTGDELAEGDRLVDSPVVQQQNGNRTPAQPPQKPLTNGDGSVAQPKKLLDCYSDKLNALLLEFQRLQPQWCAKHSVWHMDILRSVLTIANDQPFPARFNEDDEHRFELYVESKREKVATSGK